MFKSRWNTSLLGSSKSSHVANEDELSQANLREEKGETIKEMKQLAYVGARNVKQDTKCKNKAEGKKCSSQQDSCELGELSVLNRCECRGAVKSGSHV